MAPFDSFNWNQAFAQRWMIVLLSIFIGALSHLIWDKVTHHTVPIVKSVSSLRKIVPLEDHQMTYFLFWDLHSLIGAALLVYAFLRLPSKTLVVRGKNVGRYWAFLGGCAALFCAVQFPRLRKEVLADVVILVINAVLLSILFVSIFFAQQKKDTKTRMARAGKKEGQHFRSPS